MRPQHLSFLISILFLFATPAGATTLDADLNGDGAVGPSDLDAMRAAFMTDDRRADLNGDGIVNFADLAILRSAMPGAAPLPAGVGGNPVISITPAVGDYENGDQIVALVSADFSADPTVGGTFDIVYDPDRLSVANLEQLPLGDPDFTITPVLFPGLIQGLGFGDFDSVVGGDAARVTFQVESGLPAGSRNVATSVTMRDGTGGGGPFFSAVTFAQQTVDYLGADYTVPEIPQADYVGRTTTCTVECDGFAALGGPGSDNVVPSYLAGFLQIVVEPGGNFTEQDIVSFRLALGNDNVPEDSNPNPTLANPYFIDDSRATISGSGTVDVDGVLNSGQLNLAFLEPPLSTNQATLVVDIAAGQFSVTFANGATSVADGVGGFVGQPGPAAIAIAPGAVNFQPLEVDTTASTSLTLRNLGLQDLVVGTIGSGDPLAPPYALQVDDGSCSGQTLSPGLACQQGVDFQPQAPGVYEDSFDVPSNDAANPVVTVAVTGEAFGNGDIVVTPTSGVFGQVAIGSSASIDFTVSNEGNGDLTLSQVGEFDPLNAPYSITSDSCSGQIVPPAAICTVTVEFAPQIGGFYPDALSIHSDDPDQPVLLVLMVGQTPPVPAVMTISGTDGGFGRCKNEDRNRVTNQLLFGEPTLVCDDDALLITSGDSLVLFILAQVDNSGGAITGSVSGITPTGAACANIETSEQFGIELPGGDTSFNCTDSGLNAAPGDRVLVIVRGISN